MWDVRGTAVIAPVAFELPVAGLRPPPQLASVKPWLGHVIAETAAARRRKESLPVVPDETNCQGEIVYIFKGTRDLVVESCSKMKTDL